MDYFWAIKIQADKINNNSSNSGFFQTIYNYLLNLIQRNPQKDSNEAIIKLNQSIGLYEKYYSEKINIHIDNPSICKTGIINLLNDCYIVTFLQILFHTPKFLDYIRKYNDDKKETIFNYLIFVSEYPFNVQYFYNLKQLLGTINPEYSKPYSNDSQEFGIDLINYLISEIKGPINDYDEQLINESEGEEKDFILVKKQIFDSYISSYHKKINDLEKLFLFYQVDIFYGKNFKNPSISSNLHMELTLQKYKDYTIESLIDDKYKTGDNDPINNQIIIKSKIVKLPEILIITINRVLNNQNINNSKIIFNGSLDLKNYIDYDLFQDNNKKTTYHLYAINECVHTRIISHYICHIKIENKWFIFDDDKITEEPSSSFVENINSPYVVGLFYKRDA